MRSTVAVAALSLACGLLVAGCDARTVGAEPTPSGPATATATRTPRPLPSPTPSPAADEADVTIPPEPPAALQGPATEGNASLVAGYFHELHAYAFATGDLTAWRELSSDSCNFCAGVVERVEAEFAEGKHHVGGQIELLSVRTFHYRDQQYDSVIVLREHPSKIVAADGSFETDLEQAQDVTLEMLLTWTGERWVIDGVDIKYTTPA